MAEVSAFRNFYAGQDHAQQSKLAELQQLAQQRQQDFQNQFQSQGLKLREGEADLARRQALAQRGAQYAQWADTPEKWAMAQQRLTAEGFPEASQYGFEMRAAILAGGQQEGPRAANDPASVAEFKYFQSLTPQQQQDFTRLRRAERVIEAGGVKGVVGPGGEFKPIATLEDELKATQAKTAARERGETQGQAQAALPKAEGQAESMLSLIDQLKTHPGREMATGTSSLIPPVPGTATKDFTVLLDQVKGRAFLDAFESLKGGGAITEREGQAATAAMARLDRAQSEGEFLSALSDLEDIVKKGVVRARLRAGSVVVPAQGVAAGEQSGVVDLGIPGVTIRKK